MPCPAGRAPAVRVDGLVVALDDIGPRRTIAATALRRMENDPLADPCEHEMPHRRQQKGKPDRIGKEAGRQKQRPGKKDHRAMDQRCRGIAVPVERGAKPVHLRQPLPAQERGADHGGQHHHRKRRPEANRTAHLDEQRNLDQRHRHERNKKPHWRTLSFPEPCGGLGPARHLHRDARDSLPCPARQEVLMNSPILQLLVLAGIAIFLILRLKSVLGTRDGFEGPPRTKPVERAAERHGFEVIEGGPDHDIIDNVPEDSDAAAALAEMKRIEPDFGVTDFLQGARGAYEMILMSFERGTLDEVTPFLSPDVYEAFAEVVDARQQQGLTVEAEFVGVRHISIADARFDTDERRAEIDVHYVGELITVVRDANGEIVEGEPGRSKRQKDSWTYERIMGSGDPNWRLVATGE